MENELDVPKWPLTGPHRVEVTRWWYAPSSAQNGGFWVFELLVRPEGGPESSSFRGRRCLVQTFEIRVQRQREDGVTKRRKSIPFWAHSEFHELPVKAIPGEFAMVYREQHALALRIAQKAEERYLKARGEWTPESDARANFQS